ncbi:hypothetical protein HELRODRAFT_193493, partial [Helobdella robusta]|uniref:Uncharacterized protein n=1 Tax=Helobdella robusta TaxID=6412 RepID=T1FV18_HELRO
MSENNWKRCLEWIMRCDILESDHKLSKSNVELVDFAQALRDGVIICQLLNTLVPGVLEQREFSQRPQMSQFLCSKNIKVFLLKCREVFQLPLDCLFQVADLLDMKDFSRVINTLSILSNSRLAVESGIKGFNTESDQDYGTLKGFANLRIEDDGPYTKYDDKIYQDLISIRRQESMMDQTMKVSKMTKREYCIKELVETEQFQKKLVGKLDPKDNAALFKGIEVVEDLRPVHTGFHSDLSKACHSRYGSSRTSGHMTIPDCFIKWKEQFLRYGDYCSNLLKVQSLLDKLLSQSPTREAITLCQMEAEHNKFLLRDLLAVPMQRVLKYHILLKEPLDLMRYGHLQQDGELRYRLMDEKKDKFGYVFLFDKLLLVCKAKGTDTYTMKYSYEVIDSQVEIINNPKDKDKFGFHLNVLRSNDPLKSTLTLIFYAKSADLRNKWIESFKAAIDNICPVGWSNHIHMFILTSFSQPTICDVCRRLLKGVFYQGYKCKNTNMIVHKSCILAAKDMTGPPTVPPREHPGYRAKATSSYKGLPPPPGTHSPLNFQENDIITVLSTETDPWWLGKHGGSEGYFPKTFVTLIKPRDSSHLDDTQDISIATPHVSSQLPFLLQQTLPSRPSRTTSLVHPPPNQKQVLLNSSASFLNPSTIENAPPIPRRISRDPSNCSSPSNANLSPVFSPSPSNTSLSSNNSQNEFFGEDLAVFPWFVGEMTRERATELLEKLIDGAYLVRISKTADRK